MGFDCPDYEVLKVKTLNLDTEYSMLLKRFFLVSPTEKCSQADILRILINRIHLVTKSDSGRQTAVDALSTFAGYGQSVLVKNNEADIRITIKLLLGALIHRLLRIQEENSLRNTVNSTLNALNIFAWFQAAPSPPPLQTSKLHTSIQTALELVGEKPKTLDDKTIVDCLLVFRENMLAEEQEKPRYMNGSYEHFAQDANFLYHLNELINKHSNLAVSVNKQYSMINFLQTIVQKIESQQELIRAGLSDWVNYLKTEYSDFAEFTNVAEGVYSNELSSKVPSSAVSAMILYLFKTEHMQNQLAELDFDSFEVEMNELYSSFRSYILAGAYALVLEDFELNNNLKNHLQMILDIQMEPEDYSDKDRKINLNFLSKFITNLDIDTEKYGNRATLQAEINTVMAILSDKIKASLATYSL